VLIGFLATVISVMIIRRGQLYDLFALQLEVERTYHITTMQYSFIIFAFYGASIVTGMFLGFVADAIGRRYTKGLQV
jgi:hypothetical protein